MKHIPNNTDIYEGMGLMREGDIHMIKPRILANAVTTVWMIAYTLCALFVVLLPDLSFSITQTWFHFLNVGSVHAAATQISFGSVIIGVLALGATIWILTYCSAALYNKWAK